MAGEARKVPVYCYQCVAGPDLLKVKVEDGVATEVEPNFQAAEIHPGSGKVCVKAYGLVQKTYNPHRIQTPMKRTNPQKGREHDPGFVPISWDEALDAIAAKLNEIRDKGLIDDAGFPRVAASFGGGGTPTSYMGTFPAFLSAWGTIDMSFGSGQGVKCYHSEHLYGELWHRAFTVCPDTAYARYVLSFGNNVESSGGVVGVWRHSQARIDNHMKRVQVEPHLSVTAGASSEWVPVKPKTDPAFLYGMIHVALHELPRDALDLPFLKDYTASPYLVAPNGFYLRDPKTREPLIWDGKSGRAVPHNTQGAEPVLEGPFTASGIEVGPDEQVWEHKEVSVDTAFDKLIAHVADCTPEWAERICDIAPGTVRRIAQEWFEHAQVGATIEIDGQTLPYRPVAITLGKTVNNGWGGYDCCWARTVLATLVGGLEVPGGILGSTVRLNRPATSRQASVQPGPDGFMAYPMNPTDKEGWQAKPRIRNAYQTLVPLTANSPWSAALGPTHLAWLFQKEQPDHWPEQTRPELWFFYRTNPAISAWDAPEVANRIADFPFVVAFAYTPDESNHMADILLPESTDLEATQLIRIGGTKYQEQYWDYSGFALRQPVAEKTTDAMDFTEIATQLAARTGLLERYNRAINNGAAGIPLATEDYDFSLDTGVAHSVEAIWDASCKAASSELSNGASADGLDWFRENGFKVKPYSRVNWYLFPMLVEKGLRFELPYQERLLRVGGELANRLHESGITWWDTQLEEYHALPPWRDFPAIWEQATVNAGGDLDELRFWLLTAHTMQYAWGGNVGIQMIKEVANNVAGHEGVIINTKVAEEMGIADGDAIEITSALRATRGRAVLRHGIRPDTVLMLGQFDHWATPVAKDFGMPSLNTLAPISLELTDATGSSADLVRVGIRKLAGRA